MQGREKNACFDDTFSCLRSLGLHCADVRIMAPHFRPSVIDREGSSGQECKYKGCGDQVFKRRMKPYIPDFKLAFEHVCIHTGGRGVVEEIEKQLAMTPALMQPSKDTLFRYGNTSSSSIWCVADPCSAAANTQPRGALRTVQLLVHSSEPLSNIDLATN